MDSAIEKDGTQLQNNNFGTFQAFTFIKQITTWLEALLVNMSKLWKIPLYQSYKGQKENIVQMRPLTAEIKNNS